MTVYVMLVKDITEADTSDFQPDNLDLGCVFLRKPTKDDVNREMEKYVRRIYGDPVKLLEEQETDVMEWHYAIIKKREVIEN